jgi:hypothetical protein
VRLAPGEVLLVTGGDAAERTALLLGLGGRAPIEAERLTVTGLAMPVRAAAVRSRTSYVRAEEGDAPRAVSDAVAARPLMVMVDSLDLLGEPEARQRVRAVLEASEATFVIAARDAESVDEVLPRNRVVRTVALDAELLVPIGGGDGPA